MENMEYILSLVGTTLSCVAALLTLGVKFIKAIKEMKSLMSREKIAEKLPELITEAEKFIEYSGKEKKAYVLDKISEYAKSAGIEADLQFVSEKIDKIVAASKRMK